MSKSSSRADHFLDQELYPVFMSISGADPTLIPEYRAELVRRFGRRTVLEAVAGARSRYVDPDRLVELLGYDGLELVVDVVEQKQNYTRSAIPTR
jgi:hypothetical protein